MRTPRLAVFFAIVLGLLLMLGLPAVTRGQGGVRRYEAWVIDQADVGRGGARLYIYNGQQAETGRAAPETVDLTAAAAGVGDGAGVRPHMVLFNSTGSHAVIANVASGHVFFVRTRDRRVVASIRVGIQAHAAYVAPDDASVLVANQNGKRIARIRSDFAAERFTYVPADDLNLGAMEDAAHPDNAPICPILFAGSKAYVTLRGGGLYVIDYRATPMRVLRAYGREEVAPSGCGGIALGEKIYVNSGTATSSDLYVLDAASDSMLKHMRLSWTGSDAHGMAVTGSGRYLWVANRGEHNIAVIHTGRDAVVGLVTGFGAAPDLLGLSPDGRFMYISLRGPNNLTGGPSAKGETPGLAVLEVDEGRGGRWRAFLPIGDQTLASPNDPHGLAILTLR